MLYTDWTEDPIFSRVSGRERTAHKAVCVFNSSQESMETNRSCSFTSTNPSSSSASVSGHNISLKQNLSEVTSVVVREEGSPCSPIEAISHTCTTHSNDAVRDEDQQPTLRDCSRMLTPERVAAATVQDNESHKDVKDANDSQAQFNFRSSTNMIECAVQTMETLTKDVSTQSSPMAAVQDPMSSAMLSATQHNNQESSQTLMEASISISHASEMQTRSCKSQPAKTHDDKVTLIDESIQDIKARDYNVEELKKEVAKLERELGMAQSTLVWQSLMIRLYQLN